MDSNKKSNIVAEDLSKTKKSNHTGENIEQKINNVSNDKSNKDIKIKITGKSISKGDRLEYRIKRLLFYMGYYPKVGVLLKTDQSNLADTITDLDVMGIYVHKDFKFNTVWADCKSGRAKPLERISWINGVKSTVDIDEVIFVKNGIRSSTRNFARNNDIRILEIKMIDKLEKDFNIEPNDWRGSWNPGNQIKQLDILKKIGIPDVESYKRIGHYITCDYWTYDKYPRAKKSITALKQLAQIEGFPLKEEQKIAVRWAIFELVSLFTLSLFQICRELYFYNEKDKQQAIADGLLSGEISINKRNKIVDATYRTAYNIIKQHIPDFEGKIEIPKIGMNLPSYTNAFFDLINRITNDPLDYYDVLRLLDFIFMEYDLNNKDINSDELRNMFSNYDNMAISAKTILHFICKYTGIRKDIFGLFKI